MSKIYFELDLILHWQKIFNIIVIDLGYEIMLSKGIQTAF